jgi:hypothetical protein
LSGDIAHLPATGAARAQLAAALLIAAALLWPSAVQAQGNLVDGAIRGVVLDELTGQGVPGVRVEVLDHVERIRRSAETDATGAFALHGVRPGAFWLRASHPGYARTRTPRWQVGSGEILEVVIRLHPEAVLLAPLEVTARVRHASPVLARFYERLNRPVGGTLISRADIEARNPARVTDLLEGVPGVSIMAGASRNDRFVSMSRALPGRGGVSGCPVQIFVDGVIANRRGDVSPDELIAPGALEGVEVYRGLSTIPPEFLTPQARCGIIAFWTRRGRGG